MNSTLKNRLPSIPVILLSLLIGVIGISCGGGGGGAAPPPPPPTDQDAQGLYTANGNGSGKFKDGTNPDIVKTLTDIKGMVYGSLPNQKFIFFDIDTNVLYEGVITDITLNDFTGTAVVYNEGVMVDNNVAVSGTVTSRSTIDMTLAASGNFKGGRIKGLFSSAYDNAATSERIGLFIVNSWMSLVEGSVKMTIPGMLTSNFHVKSDDTYTYVSSTFLASVQCYHVGSLTSGAPKNIYPLVGERVTEIKGCTIINTSPDYVGFASVVAVGSDGKGTEMWYATTNGTYSIFMVLTR